MPSPIRLGDATNHGGSVIAVAATQTNYMGKPLACVGDPCICPLPGHTGCTIIEGDPHWKIDGKSVALDGHKTSCGASLVSSLGNVSRS